LAESINAIDFHFLREYAEQMTGSTFGQDKKYLFETRLVHMAKEFKFPTVMALINHLREKKEKISLVQKNYFIDIMTTHETLFFRDTSPFEILKKFVLPEFVQEKRQSLYIYSAACSRGQEPLSIGMSILDYQKLQPANKLNFQIMATDISKAAVDYAKAAMYTKLEVDRGLKQEHLRAYFDKKGEDYMAKPELTSNIIYQAENLLEPMARMAKFDIIFCRNATIYMDQEKVRKIYESFHSKMKPGAYFFVGHSERMTSHRDLFEYVNTGIGSVYRKK
jgi:chemotaxis protein methyltransferase CheR